MNELRFGKHPPKKDYRLFQFANYLKEDIPEPPEAYSSLHRVYTGTANNSPEYLFPMLANDRLGDCTVVGIAHGDTVFNGVLGRTMIWPEDLVVRIYNHLTDGNDTGLAMLDVLRYFSSNVVQGHKLLAYINVNPHNHVHVRQAIWLFGGLFVGFQVQEKCTQEFLSGTPWQAGKLIEAGHAIFTTGYDDAVLENLTWGKVHPGTWSWWDNCVDEAFVVLGVEAKEPGFAPGFDFARLQKDLREVANWI